jgi:hypothetical protein
MVHTTHSSISISIDTNTESGLGGLGEALRALFS